MAALVLSFVLIVNDRAAIDDPAARLVELVMDNADEVEFDNGRANLTVPEGTEALFKNNILGSGKHCLKI